MVAEWQIEGLRKGSMYDKSHSWFLAEYKRAGSLQNQKRANKACTGRWGFCAIYKQFSGFKFFLLPNRIHARPSASNASR
jgi:hypothetical protein